MPPPGEMNEANSVPNFLLDIADHRLQRAEQEEDGLDLSQLMTLLFPSCPCDEVVISKVAFTDLRSIQARNTDSERVSKSLV